MEIPTIGIVVDASCRKDPHCAQVGYFFGLTEWKVFDLGTQEHLFRSKVYPRGNANIGEFMAIVQALRILDQKGDRSTPVYSDSQTAMAWVRNKKVKTNLPLNKHTATLLTMLRQAEDWIQNTKTLAPVLFWNNRKWYENPADYGRK